MSEGVSKMSSSGSVAQDVSGADKLTVFTFLWACQALVHQEFYSRWLQNDDPTGWVVTVLAMAALLRPSAVWLFIGLLISSVVYNVLRWPFVHNHILVETIANITILAAFVSTFLSTRGDGFHLSRCWRQQVYDRFAPVLIAMLVMIYYFAFVAKLNRDFVNPDVSSVIVMYGDLRERFAFLPTPERAGGPAIVLTLIVEAAIPILLTFRRTRYVGVLLGIPFHLILGLVGHRTFSALAFAMYGLFCMNELTRLVTRVQERLSARCSAKGRAAAYYAISAGCVLCVGLLILADRTGNYESGIGPLRFFRIPWAIWILWSLCLGLIFCCCAWMYYRGRTAASPATVRPGILWGLVLIVALNGLSQYLGFKTETSFTMYSNLRTEGSYNNHFFMPAWRLASYQDDLVQIAETSIPELKKFTDGDLQITYFELRRILSTTKGDFEIVYLRNGERYELRRRDNELAEADVLQPHSILESKLLYFRPVSTAEHAPHQH